MSRRIGMLLLVGLVTCAAASAAFAAYHRERISFAGKCWRNSNPLSECSCTFNALKELPENYRALAVSWAHDAGTVYAANVMYLIAAEAHRITLGKMWNTSDPRKTVHAWVWNVGKAIGWAALRKAAPTVAANLTPAAGIIPVVYDATAEFAKARSILDRHCRSGSTFIMTVNETREAAETIAAEIASGTMEVITDAAFTSARTSRDATVGVWGWLKSWVWD